MKIIVKSNWRTIRNPLFRCASIPFSLTLVFTIFCMVSQRPEIRADRYGLPLFSLTISFLLILLFYFILASRRISFDGEKLIFYQLFFPVKAFSVREIGSVEYFPPAQYLLIDRKHVWGCRLFPEKDIDALLETLSQRHGIKTGKISKSSAAAPAGPPGRRGGSASR